MKTIGSITIDDSNLTIEDALYCRYSGEVNPQSCYMVLDPTEREIGCMYDPEIGNAVPMAVWHGRIFRFPIPTLTATAARAMMEDKDVLSLVTVICDNYAEEWDGSNWKGRLWEAGQSAKDKLKETLEDYFGELVTVVDADDWLYGVRDKLGVTSQTSDAELDQIATRLRAWSEGVHVIHGLDEYLESLRAIAD